MQTAIEALEQYGFLMRDELLATDVFERHKEAALRSWESGSGWATRIKAGSEAMVLARQDQSALEQIEPLIRAHSEDGEFQYLYHSMHEDQDDAGIIPPILADVRAAWSDVISLVAPDAVDTNLSLTSFTPGCFLDAHNDLGDGSNKYLATLLLYFGSGNAEAGGLVFDFRGSRDLIVPVQNRSVLFVPTSDTEHWIERIPGGAKPRLALSGWLL